jgi:mono/diheme cytochrome c family protein
MSGFLKWTGIILGIIVSLILVAVVFLYIITENKFNRRYDIQVEPVDISADEESIERGQHLVEAILLCQECHGKDFSGSVLNEGPWIGTIPMTNLTSGAGGIGSQYSDEDWVRAIRHGVRKNGGALLLMPSSWFYFLNDEDLADVIAYIKSLPPVDNQLPERKFGPLGRFFILSDPELINADYIDHQAPRPAEIAPGATKEYGEYLANTCKSCHGENLGGGEQVGAGLNLTPGGDLANWTFEDFKRTLRTGKTPDDHQISPEDMPYLNFQHLDDMEIEALWLYIRSLPPVESPPTNRTP